MALNNYNPTFQEYANTMWASDKQHFNAQGSGNDENLSYQQAMGFDTMYSNNITPATYYETTNYIVPTGGVALVTWNDPLNREGKVVGAESWSTYESMVFPGIKFDVFAKEGCADTTSLGGGLQDSVINYEFILNYSINKQPLTTGTPIFKYAILSS